MGPPLFPSYLPSFSFPINLYFFLLLALARGRIYGLVGINGSGKTTLLKKIHLHKIPGIPSNLKTSFLDQNSMGSTFSIENGTLLDYILSADEEISLLLKKEKELKEKKGGMEENEELNRIQGKLCDLHGYEFLKSAQLLMKTIKIPSKYLNG